MEPYPFGVLTVAYGPARYKRQAIALAQSIRLHNPGLEIACVTDDPDDSLLKKYFDRFVPYKPELGKGFRQKLYFDHYSPFAKTMYIDSDCLVCSNLLPAYELVRHVPFATFTELAMGGWWYMDVEKVRTRFGFPFLHKFNGGFFYFEDKPESKAVFNKARQFVRLDPKLKIFELGNWFNDEPFYGVALSYLKVAPVIDPNHIGMNTPAEITDPFEIDVLRGKCHFSRDGEDYNPTIAHFFGDFTTSFHYLRECWRLDLHFEKGKSLTEIDHKTARYNRLYSIGLKFYLMLTNLRKSKVHYNSKTPLVPLTSFATRFTKPYFSKR